MSKNIIKEKNPIFLHHLHPLLFIIIGGSGLLWLLLTGCASMPQRIDAAGNKTLTTTHDINIKDWQTAASICIDSLLQSGSLERADGRKSIVMVGKVKNSTMLMINTNLLTDKIREGMLKSGKAVITTAIGANGPEDKATARSINFQDSILFDQRTVQKDGTAIAPDYSLAGDIIQQKTVSGRQQESYFLFHMTLTDLKTGLAKWEDNVEIVKQSERAAVGF